MFLDCLDAFSQDLSDPIKDYLAPLDLPSELDALVCLASRINQRLLECQHGRPSPHPYRPPERPFSPEDTATSTTTTTTPEPMQIGQTRLTPAERQHRFLEGQCIYCAPLGHVIIHCPVRGSKTTNISTSLVSATRSTSHTHCQLADVTLISSTTSLP